jgi:hypothetical protein
MKIQDLLNSYDGLMKSAFIPNPQVQESQGQLEQAYAQLSQLLSSVPPEMQEQLAPMLQQLQQLPPEQQLEQISSILPALQQQAQGGEQSAQQPPEQSAQPTEEVNEQGHLNAENSLDNTKVTLSVRELLDLSSGGKATQSLLKVKQMAEAHNKKMELSEQQAAQQQQASQTEQQAATQGGMGQGGVYAQPMNASGPAAGQ